MSDTCDDNRFELIEKYKKNLIEATNIETSTEEMKVLESILFRFWQMGWLEKLELLSAQPEKMSDPIDRQAAIKAIENCTGIYVNNLPTMINKTDAYKVLTDLPPVQPEPQWIPCSERLPEEEYVLISKKPTKLSGSKWCVTVAIRTADPRSGKIYWRDVGFGVIPDDNVLAWMPLPEPYKEGERE